MNLFPQKTRNQKAIVFSNKQGNELNANKKKKLKVNIISRKNNWNQVEKHQEVFAYLRKRL